MRVILLGAPGSGKGTQAALIEEKYKLPVISTGNILRDNIADGTKLGKEAKCFMDKGELVPDDVVIHVVEDALEKYDHGRGFLMDGFPRTVYQAEMLDGFLEAVKKSINHVLLLDVSSDVLLDRFVGRRVCDGCSKSYHIKAMRPKVEGICDACGEQLIQRADDSEETAKNRIDVFFQRTAPLIEYYKNKNVLAHLDGTKSPSELFSNIEKILGE